jgi:hypothetical protein
MKTPGQIISSHPKTEVPEMGELEGTKTAIQSKTIDASVIGLAAVIVAGALNLLGAETTPYELETAVGSGIAAVSYGVIIYSRVKAKKRIKGII